MLMRMSFELTPKSGWANYEKHRELVDFLFSEYNSSLHTIGWKYMNFTSDSSLFEDPNGNTICLIFSNPDSLIISSIQISSSQRIEKEVINVKDIGKALIKKFNLRQL